MKKLSLAVAASAVFASPVFANDYQAEIGVAYGQVDSEITVGPFGSFSDDATTTSLFGEVYFDTVDTSKGPLAEAPFLSKSSGLSLVYTTVEDVDDDSWTLGGRFVTSSDWIIEATYESMSDSNTWGIGAGKYLTDSLDLVVSYNSNDDADLDVFAADLHSVVSLSGDASIAYSLGVGYLSASDENGYGLHGDLTYYFNNSFGIGASVSRDSIDDLDITTWSAHADWFITGNLDLALTYTDADLWIVETSTIMASLSYRF